MLGRIRDVNLGMFHRILGKIGCGLEWMSTAILGFVFRRMKSLELLIPFRLIDLYLTILWWMCGIAGYWIGLLLTYILLSVLCVLECGRGILITYSSGLYILSLGGSKCVVSRSPQRYFTFVEWEKSPRKLYFSLIWKFVFILS